MNNEAKVLVINPFAELLIVSISIIFIYHLSLMFFPIAWLTPLPIVVYYLRRGALASISVMVINAIIIFLIAGTIDILLTIILFIGGITGLITATMIKRSYKIPQILTAVILIPMISIPVFLGIYELISDYNVRDSLNKSLSNLESSSIQFLDMKNADDEDKSEMQHTFTQLKKIILDLYPALLAISIIISIILSLAILDRYDEKLVYNKFEWFKFRNIKIPDFLIFIFVVAGAGIIFLEGSESIIFANFLVYALFSYLIQGLAVLAYAFFIFKITRGIQLISYLLILLIPIFQVLLICTGMLNFWIPLKKKLGDLKDKMSEGLD